MSKCISCCRNVNYRNDYWCSCESQPQPRPSCSQCSCCDSDSSGYFLSSYIEAVGNTQNVASGANFVFNVEPDILDVVGRDIRVDASGTTFTIYRAGLYRVEWSMNITSTANPVIVGLMENNEPASGLTHSSVPGNHSSGALINVKANEVPYVVSLHNFGVPVSVANPDQALNSSVSIRISRFADGQR